MKNLEYLDELSKEFNISKTELVKYIAIVGTNKENIKDYALNVNCAVCRKQNGFIVDYVACMINDKDRKITELKDQLALTEKALELACNKIEHIFESDYSTAWFYAEDNKTIIERDKFEDYFKTKSKEMMKSE